MTRLVLVAPGVQPPLTEGRKLFVTELVGLLRQRGIEVELVTGRGRSSGFGTIMQSLRELRAICGEAHAPVAVFVFPYGTHSGARYYVNRFLMRRAQSICAAANVFVRPVFYSCAGLAFDELARRFRPALAVGRHGDGIEAIHLGTLRHMPMWSPARNRLQRALFLCGYQKATRAELNNVLYERGLVDAMMSGNSLAEAGIGLTIAIPFLRYAKMRKRLAQLASRWCPSLKIEMLGDGSPIELLMSHDVFLFPYRTSHAVFVPTSLLEAIQVGIPTLAADQESFRALTRPNMVERCWLHAPCDRHGMVDQLLRMKRQYSDVIAHASETAALVRTEWTLSRSADELLSEVPALR